MKVFVSLPQNSNVKENFITSDVKKRLEENFEVIYSPFDRVVSEHEFKEFTNDCDAVITGWGHPYISLDMVENSKIKLIAHTAGSVGNLFDMRIYDKGIRVISGNLLFAESVAEGTIGYMITALRSIPDYVSTVRKGNWRIPNEYTERLLWQSVGIISLGTISRLLIEKLQVFGVKIKIYSGYPIDKEFLRKYNAEQASLEEVFSTCKIVSLHSSKNKQTIGMIGKEHFDLLQDGALFINTARGEIIRENEMIEALKEKRFKAVLDVYCKEPLDKDCELRTLDNVYCIPHMAGPTMDMYPIIGMRVVENMIKIKNNEESELEIPKESAMRMTVDKR